MQRLNTKQKKILKQAVYILIGFFTFFIFISIFIYIYISNYSEKYIYTDVNAIPQNKVGLILGTSPITAEGYINGFFTTRLVAGKDLLDHKKVEYMLVSGDNRTIKYNEPKYMRNYLLKLGVPTSTIISDYAGRRTLDSVLRSHSIFNQKSITIISQKFHNERAVFIARKNGIDAVAFNAEYPYKKFSQNIFINTKMIIREVLARDIAVFDIFTGKQPEIMGEMIEIKNEEIIEMNKMKIEKEEIEKQNKNRI